uniref:hypothetical protein n=1 Tax=Nocardia abscessus TaxID=120957 RepID=UPI002453D4F9
PLPARVSPPSTHPPNPPHDHIHPDTWYGKRLRSLSVGDLVGLDDRHYTCQPRGWTRVPAPPG